MSKRIVAYQCEYCGAIKRTQTIIERHEKACIKNPRAKNCLFCKHSELTFDGTKNIRFCKLTGSESRKDISANCNNFERKKIENLTSFKEFVK